MKSQTLTMILDHWNGPLPELKPSNVFDPDAFPQGDVLNLPFNIENFCRHNDAFLDLIRVDPDRKMFAKQTILPVGPDEGVVVWKVMHGSEFDKKREPAIAWFKDLNDVNRFIFKNGDEEIMRLRSENEHLKRELTYLKGEL